MIRVVWITFYIDKRASMFLNHFIKICMSSSEYEALHLEDKYKPNLKEVLEINKQKSGNVHKWPGR